MNIVLTNPETYPTGENFREGVVVSANKFYDIMAAIEGDETRTRDDACTQLAVDAIRAAEVAIAVMQVSTDTYTFFTVKGADVLHTAITTDEAAAFTLVGFPIFRPEDATTLRNRFGDGANLQ